MGDELQFVCILKGCKRCITGGFAFIDKTVRISSGSGGIAGHGGAIVRYGGAVLNGHFVFLGKISQFLSPENNRSERCL